MNHEEGGDYGGKVKDSCGRGERLGKNGLEVSLHACFVDVIDHFWICHRTSDQRDAGDRFGERFKNLPLLHDIGLKIALD